MPTAPDTDARVAAWLAALDERHLRDLSLSEVARALRALSSCYVERRARLADGGALGSAGKRAAFALFYAPIHLLIIRHIARSLFADDDGVRHLYDLGCGTGVAGAAWAMHSGATVTGLERHPWAAAEAKWTYQQLGLDGRALRLDLTRVRIASPARSGIVAGYSINELSNASRALLLDRLLEVSARGGRVLIVEPIARRLTPWWSAWQSAFENAGGRSDDWRLHIPLPGRQQALAKAAGLRVGELTARSLALGPALSSAGTAVPK